VEKKTVLRCMVVVAEETAAAAGAAVECFRSSCMVKVTMTYLIPFTIFLLNNGHDFCPAAPAVIVFLYR